MLVRGIFMKKLIILFYLIPIILFTGCSTVSHKETGRVVGVDGDDLMVQFQEDESIDLNKVSWNSGFYTVQTQVQTIDVSEKYAESFYGGELVDVTYGIFGQVTDVKAHPNTLAAASDASGLRFLFSEN